MNFEYKSENIPSGAVKISLSGELMEKGQAVKLLQDFDTIVAKGNPKVILHLKDLRYVNSTGLNVMIGMFTKARRNGGELIVVEVSDRVKELFLVTKLNTVFNVVDTIEQAEEKLATA